MDQKEVDHTGNGVGAIHSRGTILEDVDVIDHREGNEVNVHASAKAGDAQRTSDDTFAIDQDQSLFGQQATQVELDGAVTTVADVEVDRAPGLLRDKLLQVRCVPDAQLLNVLRPIRVDRIWPGLLRCRDV